MYTKLRFSIDNLEDLKKTQSRFTLLFSIQKMKREMKGNINKHVVSILKAEGPISSEISWQTNKKRIFYNKKHENPNLVRGWGGVLVLLVFFNFTAYLHIFIRKSLPICPLKCTCHYSVDRRYLLVGKPSGNSSLK